MKTKTLSFLAILFMLIGLIGIYKNNDGDKKIEKKTNNINVGEKEKEYDYYISTVNQEKGSDISKFRFNKIKDTLPPRFSKKDIVTEENIFEKPFVLSKDLKKGEALTYDGIKEDEGEAIPILIKSNDVDGIDNDMIINGGKVDLYLLKKNNGKERQRTTTTIKIAQGVKIKKEDSLIRGMDANAPKGAYLWLNEKQIQDYYEFKELGRILILPASNIKNAASKAGSKLYIKLKNELEINKITQIKGSTG